MPYDECWKSDLSEHTDMFNGCTQWKHFRYGKHLQLEITAIMARSLKRCYMFEE